VLIDGEVPRLARLSIAIATGHDDGAANLCLQLLKWMYGRCNHFDSPLVERLSCLTGPIQTEQKGTLVKDSVTKWMGLFVTESVTRPTPLVSIDFQVGELSGKHAACCVFRLTTQHATRDTQPSAYLRPRVLAIVQTDLTSTVQK
jgi:hypothetical protein